MCYKIHTILIFSMPQHSMPQHIVCLMQFDTNTRMSMWYSVAFCSTQAAMLLCLFWGTFLCPERTLHWLSCRERADSTAASQITLYFFSFKFHTADCDRHISKRVSSSWRRRVIMKVSHSCMFTLLHATVRVAAVWFGICDVNTAWEAFILSKLSVYHLWSAPLSNWI